MPIDVVWEFTSDIGAIWQNPPSYLDSSVVCFENNILHIIGLIPLKDRSIWNGSGVDDFLSMNFEYCFFFFLGCIPLDTFGSFSFSLLLGPSNVLGGILGRGFCPLRRAISSLSCWFSSLSDSFSL